MPDFQIACLERVCDDLLAQLVQQLLLDLLLDRSSLKSLVRS